MLQVKPCSYVWTPQLAFPNARDGLSITYVEVATIPEFGFCFKEVRVQGIFAAPMGFRRFPMDKQNLPILLRLDDPKGGRSELISTL